MTNQHLHLCQDERCPSMGAPSGYATVTPPPDGPLYGAEGAADDDMTPVEYSETNCGRLREPHVARVSPDERPESHLLMPERLVVAYEVAAGAYQKAMADLEAWAVSHQTTNP